MTLLPFVEGWTVTTRTGSDPVPVVLAHDAMITETRSAAAPTGHHGGYFPGGRYVYRKVWRAPAEWAGRRVRLLFEGVYRESRVRVNDVDVGGSHNGYREFAVDIGAALRFDAENVVEVVADNTELPNSRWYTGSGIYRPVSLQLQQPVHLADDGVHVRTLSIGATARVEVECRFANEDGEQVEVEIALLDGDGRVAHERVRTDGSSATVVLDVPRARLWSDVHPHLYRATVALRAGAAVLDEYTANVGIRIVSVDAQRGLLVNGEPVLLRGGNVHHDNGVLGAATLRAAEFRRARILKENGFNAVRSAHNPISRDLLDACDEHGLFVMDELTDTWLAPKTAHDDARTFAADWPGDLTAMVTRCRNHPSVILYSISNENSETATADGVETARRMVELLHGLDPTRLVTAGVNIMLNVGGAVTERRSRGKEKQDAGDPTPLTAVADSATFNVLLGFIGPIMKAVSRTKSADLATRGIFDVLDVAGYNYGSPRFAKDARRHPSRLMMATEDTPADVAATWPTAERVPALIGAFVWTAWDYLGEAGVGTWTYGRRLGPLYKAYPHLTAGCGVIDITGLPGAPALLLRAAWGLLDAPGIAVRPLDLAGRPVTKTPWRHSDAIQSWSWRGREGTRARVEVYSGDEVELLLNGRSLGRKAAGADHGFVARFDVRYEPGSLVAVNYRAGTETGRTELRSARGNLRLALVAERLDLAADGQDLAFVEVRVIDEDGTVESLADDLVHVDVQGDGTLAGFGSGAHRSEESFTDGRHTTHYGRALAVVRATDRPGTVTVTARSARLGTAELKIITGGTS